MSGEWVHPGQTLIWAVWVLAAATEGETPSGRGGFSEDRVGGFPCLGGFSTGGMKLSLRGLRGPAEGSIVTWGHLINVPALLEAPGPEPPAGAHGRSTENPSAALGLPVPCGGGGGGAWGALCPGHWGRGVGQSLRFCGAGCGGGGGLPHRSDIGRGSAPTPGSR